MRYRSSNHIVGGESSSPITVERAVARFDDGEARWFQEWRLPDGETWLAAAMVPDGAYLLRMADLADFLIDGEGARVRVFAEPGTSDEKLRHLLLDQVLPLVLSHRGKLVLHASAAVLPRGAVVLMAAGGSGKSTLAAALGRRGAQLLGDDAIELSADDRGLVARATYPGLRLWPDVMGAVFGETGPSGNNLTIKCRLGPGEADVTFTTDPACVAGIYQLAPAAAAPIRIEPLSAREAVMALLRHAYALDVRDGARLQRQLDRTIVCGRLAPVRRLVFPHQLERLEEVCDALLHDV